MIGLVMLYALQIVVVIFLAIVGCAFAASLLFEKRGLDDEPK